MTKMANNPTQAVPQFRSPEFKDIYSNNSRISASPFDFTMMFSRMADVGGGVTALEDLVHVRMSPYQFKIFVEHLVDTLSAWEELFGNIPETMPRSTSKQAIIDGLKNLRKAQP
jgi:Protein of unknown function (DUF3467)